MKRLLLPALALALLAVLPLAAQQSLPAPPVPAPPVPPASRPDTAAQGGYIRFVHRSEGETAPDRLQTAIVRFEKGGESVDLVGVVHLADAAYYAQLDERLASYDAVLYEMVGGPHPGPESPSSAEVGEAGATAEAGAEANMLRQLQQAAKGFLGLEFQLDGIDYAAPNFVHADVAWEEMDALMTNRNESLATLFTRAMSLAEKGELQGLPGDEAAMRAMSGQLFSAVLTGNVAELKRSLAPLLSQAENFIVQIEGEDGTVLVAERNRVALAKLAELRAARPAGSYAIFYGAGHMPDFERRLLAEGFRKGSTTWLDAWTIPAPGTPEAAPTGPPPLQTLLRALTENPEVQRGLQDMGSLLEQLGGAVKSLAPETAPEDR
jgi:hypothetical protein